MALRLVASLTLVLLGGLAAGAHAQQHGHHGHSHPGSAPTAGTPHQHHAVAAGCNQAFEETVREGRGFGMAFVADRAGYPGPLHVLELKDVLRLSPDQEAATRKLLDAMYAESRPKSARLLDAEARLAQLFAGGRAEDVTVKKAVGEVEAARADVRMVHLAFHLKMRDALTDEQRRLYHEARWGRNARGSTPQTPTR
jgi:Spy/CpxP family protein refolding chaperone